ncbi:hypothetical protein P170DRAFT_168283 [Aspergillus steynii IBT 23096]|uniref:Uncharacterized protein n=1 Tax=Aspergillus steynii IBT 23096 TaxID=1392250 RepID=A0A2I2G7J1_9EURO|nr:uncharacterized protein P170DRAFT_168283 [Aspergillus steynii IBT 23096]PLB48845.1 hypothetical protein P170DRAFT_168283 [Aspergillus steynii IBT 23096]
MLALYDMDPSLILLYHAFIIGTVRGEQDAVVDLKQRNTLCEVKSRHTSKNRSTAVRIRGEAAFLLSSVHQSHPEPRDPKVSHVVTFKLPQQVSTRWCPERATYQATECSLPVIICLPLRRYYSDRPFCKVSGCRAASVHHGVIRSVEQVDNAAIVAMERFRVSSSSRAHNRCRTGPRHGESAETQVMISCRQHAGRIRGWDAKRA